MTFAVRLTGTYEITDPAEYQAAVAALKAEPTITITSQDDTNQTVSFVREE